MGPGKHDPFLVTVSGFLKAMAPGFPDLEVLSTSLITSNGPLLIKLPDPIIFFILNQFILRVFSASCVYEYHNFIMCCVKKHFLLVLFFWTPCFDHFWVPSQSCIYFFLGWMCHGALWGQQKPTSSNQKGETSGLPQHRLQKVLVWERCSNH